MSKLLKGKRMKYLARDLREPGWRGIFHQATHVVDLPTNLDEDALQQCVEMNADAASRHLVGMMLNAVADVRFYRDKLTKALVMEPMTVPLRAIKEPMGLLLDAHKRRQIVKDMMNTVISSCASTSKQRNGMKRWKLIPLIGATAGQIEQASFYIRLALDLSEGAQLTVDRFDPEKPPVGDDVYIIVPIHFKSTISLDSLTMQPPVLSPKEDAHDS